MGIDAVMVFTLPSPPTDSSLKEWGCDLLAEIGGSPFSWGPDDEADGRQLLNHILPDEWEMPAETRGRAMVQVDLCERYYSPTYRGGAGSNCWRQSASGSRSMSLGQRSTMEAIPRESFFRSTGNNGNFCWRTVRQKN